MTGFPLLSQRSTANSFKLVGWWRAPLARSTSQVVLALAIALTVLAQGIRAPFVKDAEPQSAQWIADIVDHGNWLLPEDYYHVANRKPPLFYWLSAIVAQASGGRVDEVRARAVSLVAGAVLSAEVMAWTGARLGPYGGWLAFVFLLGSYGFAARASSALTDMLLTLLVFSSYVLLMPLVTESVGPPPVLADGLSGARASHWRTAAAGLLVGLAILTKGPVAAVLLALAVFIYCLLIRANPFRPLTRAWLWVVLAISLVIAAAWYLPAFIAGRTAHFGQIVFQENLGHFLPTTIGGTGEAARPIYYIGLRLVGGSLPLSLLIPAVLLSCTVWIANIRSDLLYQLAMVLAVLLLFSIASAKRDDYILPALPSLAILFAAQFMTVDGEASSAAARDSYSPRHAPLPALAQHGDAPSAWLSSGDAISHCSSRQRLISRLRDAAVGASSLAILAGTLGVVAFVRRGALLSILGGRLASSDASYLAIFVDGIRRLTPPFVVFLLLVAIGAALALTGIWSVRSRLTGAGFGLLCLAGSTLWIGTVKPMEASSRSLVSFAAEVRAQAGNAPVYVAHYDPELAWYYGRAVPVLPRTFAVSGPPATIIAYFVGRPGDLTILKPSVRKRMRVMIRSHLLGVGGSPALYRFEAAN